MHGFGRRACVLKGSATVIGVLGKLGLRRDGSVEYDGTTADRYVIEADYADGEAGQATR